MDIFDPILQSQALVKQLSSTISDDKAKTHTLLNSLAHHLDHIKANTSSMQQQIMQLSKSQSATRKHASMVIAKPEIKSGCYVFSGDKGFFCPRCYDVDGNKVATTRLNSKLRICPACRASIK